MSQYLPPKTDAQLEWYTQCEKRTCLLFIKYKVFPRHSICNRPDCGSHCRIVSNTKDWHKSKYKDPSHYECKTNQSHTHSIRTGTIYSGSP